MDRLQEILALHGPWVLFLLAVVEGPFVVLAATALARLGTLEIGLVWTLAVLADLVGDLALYATGRFLPGLLPQRLRPGLARDQAMALFRHSGGRLLLLGKFTHVAGLPVLIASGFGQMPLVPFLAWTLAGTVVKVSALVAIGWAFWQAVLSGRPDDALILLAALGVGLGLLALFWKARRWQ